MEIIITKEQQLHADKSHSYRKWDAANFIKLQRSIELLGQIRPIYITCTLNTDAEPQIIEGSRIYLACKHLNMEIKAVTIPVFRAPVIRAIMNESWFESDYAKLGQLLKQIDNHRHLLPLSDQDILNFIDFSEWNPGNCKPVVNQIGLFD